eukprot:CAMPEP_0179101144 /NCGR_PEP_ID=MMETSP0796-20121207/46750_1 /TAXON_ID=73915 /ORGANISM="Pyrodinium bahamense, Strain pbaha01" /LENGTH=62 /DNA_ID=CAMNT_0020798989 /DNA_START=214 /DNA_END=402 /DNA_ORIENTATION=-
MPSATTSTTCSKLKNPVVSMRARSAFRTIWPVSRLMMPASGQVAVPGKRTLALRQARSAASK